LQINNLVKPFLLQSCMSLFPTLAEYFMYSHMPYFLYIAAMPYYSKDEEFFDEDFFYACEPPIFCLWCDVLFCYVDLLIL
jgi:hypothetical protein